MHVAHQSFCIATSVYTTSSALLPIRSDFLSLLSLAGALVNYLFLAISPSTPLYPRMERNYPHSLYTTEYPPSLTLENVDLQPDRHIPGPGAGVKDRGGVQVHIIWGIEGGWVGILFRLSFWSARVSHRSSSLYEKAA